MKYLIAVASPERAKPLADLLGAGPWTCERRVGRWAMLVHTDAAGEHLGGDGGFFKGWYVDHAGERLGFAPSAEPPAPARPLEGCYVTACPDGDALTIGHDLFAQLPLLHFSEPDLFVASDSLFAIAQIRRALGLACRLEPQVARARAWTRSLALQTQSDRTILSGVFSSGVGASLRVGLAGEALACEVRRTPARELFRPSDADYVSAVRGAAVRIGRHLASLAAAGQGVSCSLSGGEDSRAVVAAASRVANAPGKVGVTSYRYAAADFEIAKRLAALAGLAFRQPPGAVRAGPADTPLARWLAHSAGIYDRMEFAPDIDPALGVLTVGGHGGEVLKGMWNWRRLGWQTCAAPLRFQSALRAECGRGLRAMGLSPWEPWSAEWHYLGYRNAVHGGRRSANYLLHGSPLMQRGLAGFVRSDARDRRRAVLDLTILFSPEMAVLPYTSREAPSRTEAEDRLQSLGGPVDARRLEPYAIVGRPAEARVRSSPVILDLAARLAPDPSDAGAAALALAGFDRCPDELRPVYLPMRNRLLAAVESGAPLGPTENFSKAKLLALHLADPPGT